MGIIRALIGRKSNEQYASVVSSILRRLGLQKVNHYSHLERGEGACFSKNSTFCKYVRSYLTQHWMRHELE